MKIAEMNLRASWRALSILLVVLWGCRRSAAIWIESPATSTKLTFGLARSRGASEAVESLNTVIVEICHELGSYPDVYWEGPSWDRPWPMGTTHQTYNIFVPCP